MTEQHDSWDDLLWDIVDGKKKKKDDKEIEDWELI